VLKLESLNTFYDEVQALHDISLEVEKGRLVTLIGSNGAGKTTTLRTISGLIRPSSGTITFDGLNITTLSSSQIVEHGIIQVAEGRLLFPFMTVYENLQMGSFRNAARKDFLSNLEYVYKLFPKLEDRKKQLAGLMSGGEQQMLAIGRALMANPKLLMLDEPSLGLAPKVISHIYEVIGEIRKLGITILLVEQNIYYALQVADKAYLIENGRIIASGSSTEIKEHKLLKEAYLGL
jgi:branched-chain amino acid transport system ATP-binding protein